jgi:hypothetical protein
MDCGNGTVFHANPGGWRGWAAADKGASDFHVGFIGFQVDWGHRVADDLPPKSLW